MLQKQKSLSLSDLQKHMSHLRYMSFDELTLTQLHVLYHETFT